MSRIPPGFRNGLDDWISAPLRWEWFTRRLPGLQRTLLTLLEQARPHCVISTSPAYTAPLSQIAAVGQSRPFRLITLVTASNSSASTAWRNCESDYFCVEHDDQAASLRGLWDEFEAGTTPEARFANALDRFHALLQNVQNRGGTWKRHGVSSRAWKR